MQNTDSPQKKKKEKKKREKKSDKTQMSSLNPVWISLYFVYL